MKSSAFHKRRPLARNCNPMFLNYVWLPDIALCKMPSGVDFTVDTSISNKTPGFVSSLVNMVLVVGHLECRSPANENTG